MAYAIVPISNQRSSLLKPLDENAVLVPNEQVYYAERQHWASVVQPVYETFVILLAVVWVIGWFNSEPNGGVGAGNNFVTVILVAAAIHASVLIVTGGRLPTSRLAVDPFSKPGAGIGRTTLMLIIGAVVFGVITIGAMIVGILFVAIVIGRLTIELAKWSFYERRYITNRRVIESGGFLGSRISSMPLSRVTDISYGRSIPGELFGYATMRVETAGQDQALGVVRYIAEPDHFYEVLINFSAPQADPPPQRQPIDRSPAEPPPDQPTE